MSGATSTDFFEINPAAIIAQFSRVKRSDFEVQEQVYRILNAQYHAQQVQAAAYATSGATLYVGNFEAGTQNLPSFTQVPSVNAPVSSALKAIERLRKFEGWGDNWDAEGSPAPEAESLDAAVVLVGFLKQQKLEIAATLESQGKPMLFISGDGGEGEVTVNSARSIDFVLFGVNGDDAGTDIAFDMNSIPNQLADSLHAVGMV